MQRYLDVVLNVPLNQSFTYKEHDCTENLEERDTFGRRIEVLFGNRKLTGIVIGISGQKPSHCTVEDEKIRTSIRYIDKEPILNNELYDLAKWISSYYIANIGEVVFTMLPSGRRETNAGAGFSFEEEAETFQKKVLSAEQKEAVNGILSKENSSFLHYLYGITGSGKTEVFLSAAESVLGKGGGVIYLVPEIGLTPQVVEAVVSRFGNTAAVLHSALTPSQRLSEWNRILRKEARIVVGARSAIFAPVPALGLIIIDEEHDPSYKSGSSPRYHARQVAMYRASKLKIPLVMGSATPSVEAWFSVKNKSIACHSLTQRLAGGASPKIESVNLSLAPTGTCLSKTLLEEMQLTLNQHKQIILFLNRRGFSHFFRCNTCGFELKCKNCSVSLTFHKKENRLRCHYCGYSQQPPSLCPKCGSLDIGYFGFGTEYIEAQVKSQFPSANIIRIDTDSLTHRGELQDKLNSFRNGDYDIMLGTQMVAKGLNFPRLQLVGVILADTSLHLPDFRASERTFSLITQVAGRAGRFFPDGKVIVQSYSPDREPIAFAISAQIDDFYKNEIAQREVLGFPPFSRMLRLVFRSPLQKAAKDASNGAAKILGTIKEKGVEILGPAECPLEMIGANYRYQILLRAEKVSPLQKMVHALIYEFTQPKNVYIEVDVDPVNML